MSAIESAASFSAGAFGPHGGPFVLLESGLVELSIFETRDGYGEIEDVAGVLIVRMRPR